MKRLFLVMLAVAGVAATSCERSFDEGHAAVGGTSTVSVSLGFPTMQTRADYSDGTTATELQYSVYENTSTGLEKIEMYTFDSENPETIHISKEINFQLVTGRTYTFVFWAAAPSEDDWTSPYTVTFGEDGATMKVDYEGVKANDERYDAFFASVEKKITGDVQMSVELTRPFAQINVGTSDYEVAAAQHCAPDLSKVVVSKAYTDLDLVSGVASNLVGETTFDYGEIEPEQEFPVYGYEYLAMVYVLASTEAAADYTVKFSYKEGDEGEATTRTVSSVPVQRNHRTNMFGQVLTSTASINVIIVPEYEEPDHNYSQLLFAAAVGGTAVLDDDVEVEGELTFTKDAVIDLGGHEINATGGKYGDTFVIGNGANVTMKNGTLNPSSTAKEENASATIIIKTAYESHLTLEDMTVVGKPYAIYLNSANEASTVTIKSGTYYTESVGNNGPAVYVGKGSTGSTIGGKVTIYGGTFGVKGVVNDYLLNVEDVLRKQEGKEPRDFIEVFGGTFYNFDPANNKAEGVGTNFVAKGYKSVETVSGTDKIYVVVPEEVVVATDAAELANAVKTAGATVQLMSGNYTFTQFAENVTIIGSEGTVCTVTGNNGMNNGATFKNVKFDYPTTGYYPGFTGCANLTYENCEFEGEPFSYAANAVYKNCTFNQTNNAYNIWGYTSSPLTFDGCTFYCAGKGLLIYNEGLKTGQTVYVKNCKFYASQPASGKAAIEISSEYHSVEVYIDNCTAEGFDAGSVSKDTLWNCKNDKNPVTIYVDGEKKYQKQ